MYLPTDKKKLMNKVTETLDRCRISAGSRAANARTLRQWKLTGSVEGSSAIYNKLGRHVDRMSSWIYSPSNLKLAVEFDNYYPRNIIRQGEMAARLLTREMERRDIDITFGDGVGTALEYGCAILKTIPGHGGAVSNLVMPWQFGVYNEGITELGRQEAMSETNFITPEELWRRISHFPDAHALYRRARSYSRRSNGDPISGGSYFQQLVIAGTQPVVQTSAPFTQQPGGTYNSGASNDGGMGNPEIGADLIEFHEMWVIDDLTEDYVMIQYIEPDILISPLFKRTNPFVQGEQPYTVIRPNNQPGYFWGRSEMADLIRLQGLLRDRMEDIKRLMNLQFDRMLAFSGFEGMNDELYDRLRTAGWMATDNPGAKVEDLTPKLPENAFQDIETIIRFMDELSGFVPVMRGEGEPGVRAGVQASTLTKNASPRLRDQALIVERQIADVGNKLLDMRAEKDNRAYWLPGDEDGKQGTEFLLDQLPEDRRITVDSHSSSPVYQDDGIGIVSLGAKLGALGGEEIIDLLPFPQKDLLKSTLREKELAEAKFKQENPTAWLALHSGKGGKKK